MNVNEVTIPSQTYLSVPMSIINAGGNVVFDKRPTTNHWIGLYQLNPYPIYDAAKRFTSNMYIPNSFMCLSFHIKKNLGIGKGGMILTDDEKAAEWFRKARYEGRGEVFYKEDNVKTIGWNMYMTPPDAAEGLWLMSSMSKFNEDSIEDYPDLTNNDLFK